MYLNFKYKYFDSYSYLTPYLCQTTDIFLKDSCRCIFITELENEIVEGSLNRSLKIELSIFVESLVLKQFQEFRSGQAPKEEILNNVLSLVNRAQVRN